jgi:hypothetical protein
MPTGPEELAAVEADALTGSMLARTPGLLDRAISLDLTYPEQFRVWFGRALRKMHPADASLAS